MALLGQRTQLLAEQKEKITSKNICIKQQKALKEDNIIKKYAK